MLRNLTLSLIIASCLFGYSCKKGGEATPGFVDSLTLMSPNYTPNVDQYVNGVQITKKIDDPQLQKIQDYGYYLTTGSGAEQKVSLGKTPPNYFMYTLSDLKPKTNYIIKGYITVAGHTHYAPTLTFTTLPGKWKKLTNFAGEQVPLSFGPVGFAANGKGYIMFYSGDVWQYDVAADSWSPKSKFAPTVNNPGYDVQHIFFTINNIAYTYYRGGIYKYDDGADSWTNVLQRDTSITSPGKAFVVDNKAYILQSWADASSAQPSKVYDPAANTLKTISLYTMKDDASGFATDQHIYVTTVAGFAPPPNYDTVWPTYVYDPANNSFVKLDNAPGALSSRTGAVTFTINGVGYIGQGAWGTQLDTYFAYSETGPAIQPVNEQLVTNGDTRNLGIRMNGVAVVINGKAYVGFGDGRNDWWEFTP